MLADDADVSFVPMNDLGELVKYFEPKEVRKFAEVVKSYTYFADGDVLCAKITPCFENGKLGIASNLESGAGFGSSEFVVMRPKPALSAGFLYYYLSRDAFREAGARVMSGAVGHKRVPREYFEDLPIPLPPLNGQKRIVAVLDQAFAALDRARAHAEANLADAETLLEAIKFDVFDRSDSIARRVTLAEVTSIDSTLVDPRDPEFLDMPHLGAGNMISGSDALVDVMTARQEKLKSGKYQFDDTMILYSKIRPYLRKVVRPDFSGVCSADVYPLSPSAELDRDFLFHILHTKDFTEYAISGSDRAGMPKVNREHLFKYEFGLPPIAAQREAASKIDRAMGAVDGLKAVLKSKLTDIANLRQSLLQKAFSGELT